MEIKINIKKKDIFLIATVLVFLIVLSLIVAYGGNNPVVMGHNAEEVSGTITGGCAVLCSSDSSVMEACVNAQSVWGNGKCSGTPGSSPCYGACTCVGGSTPRILGNAWTWSGYSPTQTMELITFA